MRTAAEEEEWGGGAGKVWGADAEEWQHGIITADTQTFCECYQCQRRSKYSVFSWNVFAYAWYGGSSSSSGSSNSTSTRISNSSIVVVVVVVKFSRRYDNNTHTCEKVLHVHSSF